jgi:hypothetical protein
VATRARLIERRIARRLRALPVAEFESLARAISEVAALIAEEDNQTTRTLAEAHAVARLTRRS